ncbi:MAG: pilus assembly protein PilM [Chthoniobacteraceae bacterium]|nr:pilus assembly protein PilM [Chthoniobacteraceae bacterium]
MKAVLLQRRGSGRVAMTHFAVREFPEETNPLEKLEENLKALLRDLGGTAKACGIVLSSPETLVRIIEQNTIPPRLLRDALRINGPLLLSQDCHDWVIDCEAISPSGKGAAAPAPAAPAAEGDAQPKEAMVRYLVGGLPRALVQKVHEACEKNKLPPTVLQLPPVALLNAFEYANEKVFKTEAFILVDIGHRASTVIVGGKGELVLIRTLEYGGARFMEQLILQGGASFEEVAAFLEQEEVLTVENARLSLGELIHSISSSIGFYEAQREEAISRVYVSGGLAKQPTILKILGEELHLPCESWDPLAAAELSLPRTRAAELAGHLPELGAACGVATEILKGR